MERQIIQVYLNRYRDNFSGVLQYGREIGLNSKCSKKWGFIAKLQCRGLWMKNYKKEISGIIRDFDKTVWVGLFLKADQRDQMSSWEIVGDEELKNLIIY